MAVEPSDVKIYYTGGQENTERDYSLGGQRSEAEVPYGTEVLELHNLFPPVYGAEQITGSTKYRCIWVHNTRPGGDLMTRHKVAISLQPSRVDGIAERYEIGFDPAGIGDGVTTGVPQQIPVDTQPPVGVAFSQAPLGQELQRGDVDGQKGYALWVKRIVPPGTKEKRNSRVILLFLWDKI